MLHVFGKYQEFFRICNLQHGISISFLNCRDKSIPRLESTLADQSEDLDKLRSFIQQQVGFESKVSEAVKEEVANAVYPNPETECKPPRWVIIGTEGVYSVGNFVYNTSDTNLIKKTVSGGLCLQPNCKLKCGSNVID